MISLCANSALLALTQTSLSLKISLLYSSVLTSVLICPTCLSCCPFYHCQTITSLICLSDAVSWPADNSLSFIKDLVIKHTVFSSTQSTVIISGNFSVFRAEPSSNRIPVSTALLFPPTSVSPSYCCNLYLATTPVWSVSKIFNWNILLFDHKLHFFSISYPMTILQYHQDLQEAASPFTSQPSLFFIVQCGRQVLHFNIVPERALSPRLSFHLSVKP